MSRGSTFTSEGSLPASASLSGPRPSLPGSPTNTASRVPAEGPQWGLMVDEWDEEGINLCCGGTPGVYLNVTRKPLLIGTHSRISDVFIDWTT